MHFDDLISTGLAKSLGRYLWHSKGILFLMLLTFISALGCVWLTHSTRLLIVEKGKLAFQVQRLDHEWVNLTLEETTLMDKNRISHIAHQNLQMQSIQPNQEILVTE